jgi:hypothetical protein
VVFRHFSGENTSHLFGRAEKIISLKSDGGGSIILSTEEQFVHLKGGAAF